LYQAGRCWAAAGDRAAATARYARVEAEHAGDRHADDARLRAAEVASEAGDEEAAAKLLADFPQRYPKGDMLNEALWRLALAAWRAERYTDAERWLDENLRLIPREEIWYAEGRALYWKARVLERRKDPKAARTFYARAVREYPLSVYALLALARLEAEPGERKTLIRELRRNLAAAAPPWRFGPRPLFGEAGFLRAVELARMGQGTDARRELNRLGLATFGDKSSGRTEQDDDDVLWITTVLLNKGRVWNASHSIPRHILTDYRKQYPAGLGAEKWRLSYPRAFPDLVAKNARANNIPEALQTAIMREESAFNPRIESYANAVGLTQLLLKTARRFSRHDLTRETLKNPARNLEYGSQYLAFLLNRFGRSAPLAVAGYNAGEGSVDRWLADRGELAMDEFMELIPYDQTRDYTKRVLASYFAYSWLYDAKAPVPGVPLAAAPPPPPKPAPKPAAKPAAKPGAKPPAKPAAKPATKPVAKAAAKK
jgi:soluble lytic murein transglycosylase